MNYQIMLKNELEGFYKANAETKPNKGISGELCVLAEKIRQSTKADGVYRTGQNGNNVSVGDASSLEGIGFDMAG